MRESDHQLAGDLACIEPTSPARAFCCDPASLVLELVDDGHVDVWAIARSWLDGWRRGRGRPNYSRARRGRRRPNSGRPLDGLSAGEAWLEGWKSGRRAAATEVENVAE